MGLKLIIDTDTVIQRMSLQNIAEVQAAVDSIITSAHVVLQGMLQTTFEPSTRADLFYLNKSRFPTPASGMLSLHLMQGFVWPTPLTVTYSAESRKMLESSPETIPTTDYILDAVRGWLLLDVAYLDCWVKVSYSAGFNAEHKPPEWLQEAALAYMPHLLVTPTGAVDSTAQAAATEAQKMAWHVTGKIVEPYLRNRGLQYTPVASV